MKKNCSKNILLISLGILFLALAAAGVYFLLKEKDTKTNTADKYQDVLNWCDVQTSGDQLVADCKGLLLDISTQDNQNNCFTTQIISNDESLEDLELCGTASTLTYENSILDYKKLKPVDIQIQYTWDNNAKSYILQATYIAPLEESYIASIVNEDISSLVNTTNQTTTITNSVDFCPNPEMLPTYITEENINAYTNFYNSNTLSQEDYTNTLNTDFETLFLTNWKNSNINMLWGYESAIRMGYSNIFKATLDSQYKDIESINSLNSDIDWADANFNDKNNTNLMNLSLILDGMYYKSAHENYASPHIINEAIQYINDSGHIDQRIVCGLYKIINALSDIDETKSNDARVLSNLIKLNFNQLNSSACSDVLDPNVFDINGIYLKNYYSSTQDNFILYEKCNNLYFILNK